MKLSILSTCVATCIILSVSPAMSNTESRIEVLERQLSILANKVENLSDIKDLKNASIQPEKNSDEAYNNQDSDTETRISNIEDNIQALINKIEHLEKNMEDNEKLIDSLNSKFYNLTERLSEIETKIDKLNPVHKES